MRGRGSGNSDEFIREVDEAVRQDRWLQLWQHYGTYLARRRARDRLGTGAGVGWRTWQDEQRLDEARRYAAAEELLRQDHPAEAAAGVPRARRATPTAATACSPGCAPPRRRPRPATAQAPASLERLAGDDEAAPLYRAARRSAGRCSATSTAPARTTLRGRLAGLTGADAPWRHSALELRRWRSCAPARPRPRGARSTTSCSTIRGRRPISAAAPPSCWPRSAGRD